METVCQAAGGAEGLLRLAEAWHARVSADEVVGHAFRHGVHPRHTERLAAYWGEALGGPAGNDRLRTVLHEYFAWATEVSMARYPQSANDVPAGLSIPQWSWDGPVDGRS